MEKHPWFYFLAHLYPILMICGYVFEMPYIFLSLILLITAVFTIADFYVKRNPKHSYEEVLITPENDGRFSPWIYQFENATYVVLHFIAFAYGLYFVQFKEPFIGWFLYVFPMGISGSILVCIAHEYVHKTDLAEKIAGRFCLASVFLSAFEYDHLYYHHNDELTCTDKDPAFAYLNQTIYSYSISLYTHKYRNAIEAQKMISKKIGCSFFNVFRNTLLKWFLFSIAIFVFIGAFLGFKALIFDFLHVFIVYALFASTTYNQHYGLERRILKNGQREPFTYMNTWASDHFFTGKLYINLSHHGHHHLKNLCRYPHLKVIRMGPLLPYGYNACIGLSFFPKLWFKKMNPMVEEVFKQRDQLEKEGKL